MTLGAVLGTVTATAGAVSGIVGTVGKGVILLDNYVDSTLEEQRKRQALEAATYDERLIMELSMEEAQRKITMDRFCDQSPKHQEHFNSSYARLQSILASVTSKTNAPT
jgi:hypothetical protein